MSKRSDKFIASHAAVSTNLTLEQKSRWVKALRSGKYKQGQRFLNKDGNQCCLGVLCIVENIPSISYISGRAYGVGDEEKSTRTLNSSLQYKFGVDAVVSIAGIGKAKDSDLARLNDNGYTFNEIANVIDALLITKD